MADTLDELDKYFENWKKEHPILNAIDVILHNKGIADYRASYALTHPWVIVGYWRRHLRWAWQRVFRGWDDRVIWSIESYLTKMLPVWLRKLKKDKHGVPMLVFEEEDLKDPTGITEEATKKAEEKYDNILEAMAIGFETYMAMKDMDYNSSAYDVAEKTFEEGFDLFKKYFTTLWD